MHSGVSSFNLVMLKNTAQQVSYSLPPPLIFCSFILKEPYIDKSRVGAFGKVRIVTNVSSL